MVGQKNLLTVIEEQVSMGQFPRFSIIIGVDGSGKNTLTGKINELLDTTRVIIEPKVDAIREMIEDIYTVQINGLYIIEGDNLSMQAREALLKICEEPPKNAYICLLVSDLSYVLDTLKSRAWLYFMQPYTPEELLEYANVTDSKQEDIIVDLCETPEDVNKLKHIGIYEFYEFVEKVVDSIADVSPANALKIATKIDTKNNDLDKYDVALFLRAFKAVCGNRMRQAVMEDDIESQMWYSAGIQVVTNTLGQLRITGINKGALLDIFILNIRREWA